MGAKVQMPATRASGKRSTGMSGALRLVGELDSGLAQGGPVCGNCSAVGADHFEVSRLVYLDGELVATEVIKLLSCCERCVAEIVEIGRAHV